MIVDKPIATPDEDRFGFSTPAKELADLIVTSPETGYVVGVFGDWGSGKTSFMNLMNMRLKSEGYPTVWFISWKYDRRERMLAALVYETINQITPKRGRIKQSIKKAAPRLVETAAKISLGVASTYTAGVLSPGIIDEAKMALGEQKKMFDYLQQFENDFRGVIDKIASKDKKVIVFLDDLDRCLPDNVIEILEALKLFMQDTRCVFVIGVDRTVVEQAVGFRYGGLLAQHGKEYLEKVVQVQFDLPPITPKRLTAAYSKQLTSQNLDDASFDIVLSAASGNPRRMLRILNAAEQIYVHNTTADTEKIKVCMFVTCLRVCFPEFFRMLASNVRWAHEILDLLSISPLPPKSRFDESRADVFFSYTQDKRLRTYLMQIRGKVIWNPIDRLKEAINVVAEDVADTL